MLVDLSDQLKKYNFMNKQFDFFERSKVLIYN